MNLIINDLPSRPEFKGLRLAYCDEVELFTHIREVLPRIVSILPLGGGCLIVWQPIEGGIQSNTFLGYIHEK